MRRQSLLWLLLGLFVCASLGALLVTTEYSLRLLFPEKLPIYRPDTQAVASFIPNLNRDRPVRDHVVIKLETNNIGVRDDENKDINKADVWVFGDSNIAALFLPFHDTFGEVLEQLYGNRVTAINFGVPGYGPDQSLRRFLDANQKSVAKAVVFHIFADNDYGDLFRNNIYRLTDDKVVVRANISSDPVFQLEKFLLLRPLQRLGINSWIHAPEGYYDPLHRGKGLPSGGDDDLDSWVEISTQEYRNYKAGMWTSWNGDHYDYGLAAHPKGEMAQSAGKLMSYILRTAINAYKGRKECFVVLIQPSEVDVGGDSVISRDSLASHYPDYFPRALVDLSIAAAKENDIPYIDLFKSYSDDPAHFYFRQEEAGADNHWNANGMLKAAELVRAHLETHGCIGKN